MKEKSLKLVAKHTHITTSSSCGCGPSCACKNCVCGPRAAFFETLGNEGRLYILHTLRTGPKTVSDLVTATGMTQTHVSHNLKHLETYGFVTMARDGKYRVYSLAIELEPILKLIDKHVDAHYAGAAKACCCSKDHKTTQRNHKENHA